MQSRKWARALMATATVVVALGTGGGACQSGGPGSTSSSSSSGTGSNGGGNFDAGIVDNSCIRDQDCGSGQICAGDGGCSPGFPCTAPSTVCGECDVGGTQNCGFPPAASYCDSNASACRRTLSSCEPCSSDTECGFNEQLGLDNKCIDYGSGQRFCGLACTNSCSEGFECVNGACQVAAAVGTCAAAVSCMADTDCPEGTHCTTYAANPPRRGVCLAFCLEDAECPAGRRCQTQPGSNFGQCIQKCAPGATAGSSQICHEWGTYGPKCPATPCPNGFECSETADGYCKQQGCDNDDECPLVRTYCDVPTRTCVDGCNDVGDCGAFELCQAGQCVDQGCRGKDLSCNTGQFCCGTELYATGGQACPSSVMTGQCFNMQDPFCRRCEEDADCADIMAFGQASHCYELQRSDADGGTETIGKFCSVGCQTSAECPRGIQCRDLPAGENGEMVKGCLDAICGVFSPAP